jgi:hypothetical protein
MEPWIRQREMYVRPDALLADLAPELITDGILVQILGDKPFYSREEAKSIGKNQYSAAEYRARQDLPEGYSRATMLELLQERCRYVLLRGSTLNNPHISGDYFRDWEKITEDHAMVLRRLVDEWLQTSAAATEEATE